MYSEEEVKILNQHYRISVLVREAMVLAKNFGPKMSAKEWDSAAETEANVVADKIMKVME